MSQAGSFRGTQKATAMQPAELRAGTWYCGFECLRCHERFAISDDPSCGNAPPSLQTELFQVACPYCGADHLYTSRQVLHYKQP